MFSAFRLGTETNDGNDHWEDTPTYAPGRFHAHPRTTPIVRIAEDPPLASSTRRPQRRGVSRRPLVEDRAPDGETLGERSWLILRPGRERVELWLETWWRRWAVLVGIPCVFVWIWCAIPFPVSNPYVEEPPWHIPWTPEPPQRGLGGIVAAVVQRYGGFAIGSVGMQATPTVRPILKEEDKNVQDEVDKIIKRTTDQLSLELLSIEVDTPSRPDTLDVKIEDDLPVDANFYFFLFVYYGIYLAAALIFVTKLFDLYRLNWWPSALGGSVSYFVFWSLSLAVGFTLHAFNLDGLGRGADDERSDDKLDWQRKTTWVALAFASMTLPALACFAKLRADRRQSYRHSLTAAQKTFLDRQLLQRMPRSYKRFLWFILALVLSLLALIIGQGFATIYLSTLPHSNVDGLVYVWTWILTVQCLNSVSNWVLQRKVRSKALVFVFRFYYFLVYHIFYRNLFARLRSPDQAIIIQLLSSSWVILWYPLSMSKTFHRFLKWSMGFDVEYEEYKESVCSMLYLRNLSENVTMAAFLGWLTILHYGPNKQLYPFFSFDSDVDPYNYRLTAVASLIIWATELSSSFLARMVIWWRYQLDVTNIGLDEFREHPELVVAIIWASIHVLMDLLLFLIRLNFR